MAQIADRILARMKSMDLSYGDLAKLTGMHRSALHRYATGITKKIPTTHIEAIAKGLGVTPEYLMGWDTIALGDMVQIPVVSRISCGNGLLAYEDIENFETVPKEWVAGGEYFFLRAKGDSMSGARINDGDLLLIRKQPEVENGQIAAVLIDDEARLKRIHINGSQIILQSENPSYPPVLVPAGKVKIIGKLKKIMIDV